jgi:hypothetical protein
MKISRLLTTSLLILAATAAPAQSVQVGQGRDQKAIDMVHTDVAPVIDGVLDEEVWKTAAVIDDFHQIIPVEYAEPSERTEVKLLFDSEALYVGVKMFIEPDKIVRNILRRNSMIYSGDDYITISIDPFNTRRGGYFFSVNANGVRSDGLYRNVSQFYADWDSIYFVQTTIVDDGWIAEFAIPYKSFSFDPNTDTWGLNFSRRIQYKNEQMVWVSNDRRFDPSSSGLARGFHDLNQGLGLDIVTSASTSQEKNFAAGTSKSTFDPSLDVFYKLTSGMNASLTANTDFSATEIDDRQVNLTRFSLFFPEKRDFFLREADIFEFGRLNQNGRPFFSRRIGLGGNGQAIDLELGGKISGRIGDWELGALSIRQDETSTVAADTLSVLRVKKGLFSQSTIGAIFTEGNPTSNLDSSLAGVDFLYRNANVGNGRIVEVSTWYQQTDTEGVTGDDAAAGINVNFPSQEGLTGGMTFNRFEDNFRPALGFANRIGVDQMNANLFYTWRPSGSWFQALSWGADWERYDNSDGSLQSSSLSIVPFELTTRIGDGVSMNANFNKEVLPAPFRIVPGVVIPAGEYDFSNYNINLSTAGFRKLSGRFGFQQGSFYSGDQTRVNAGLTWVPSPKIRTNIGYTITDVDLPEGRFITRLVTSGFDYIFSNSISLVNLVQYDNVSEVLGLNMRLHWVPAEGQEFFFVLNHNQTDPDRDNHFEALGTTVTAKYSYTFRY